MAGEKQRVLSQQLLKCSRSFPGVENIEIAAFQTLFWRKGHHPSEEGAMHPLLAHSLQPQQTSASHIKATPELKGFFSPLFNLGVCVYM
jgi:hypothetical protein